jgi:effector-binding domain-containing protein
MSTARGKALNLTQEGEIVSWPATHYVFIEKTGPFQQTAPQTWQSLHALIPAISEHNTITGYMSLFRVGPGVYRAGVALAAPPEGLPGELGYEHFQGGKYARFTLTGPYSNLPEACGRVFDMVAARRMAMRDDYAIENYLNDPRTTPEAELITQILIPVE